jgi:large subunit ribosomal protein L21
MYAVFEDGSRQYRVSEGDVVRLDYRDAEVGSRLEFQRVLLYKGTDDLQVGRPTVAGARVVAEVVDHPSTKLYIQHFRRRKNYRRLRGHRQHYTAVQIHSILLPGMQESASSSSTSGSAESSAPSPAPELSGESDKMTR